MGALYRKGNLGDVQEIFLAFKTINTNMFLRKEMNGQGLKAIKIVKHRRRFEEN